MAKNPKKNKPTPTNGTAPQAPQTALENKEAPAISGTAGAAKRRAPSAAASTKSGSKRSTSSAAKPAAQPKSAATSLESVRARSGVSDDEIRLRAYFLAEWRAQNGIAGTSDQDWWEARRQLEAEAARLA
jgi:hypothetical protein